MASRKAWSAIVLAATTVVAGCAARIPSPPPAMAPASPPAVAEAAPSRVPSVQVEDPVTLLIATSQRHFETGQQELAIGHLERARAEFDLAVDVLLQSADGARTNPRLREHFDRLVDRISAYEARALAEGDGFTEKPYEPATIDSLLELSTYAPASPSAALKDAVASDLRATAHDIDIPLNERVLAYVELFQGRLRDYIQDGLKRGARYLPMIQNVFRAEGLPLDLAYVPLIESAFRPNALSRVRARGVWQFMAGTATAHGLKRDWYVDERSDPEKATHAAAKYLRTLSGIFAGDWHLALASYNGGPGRVQRAMQRTRLTDFWSLAGRPRALPRDTREYVPMILAAIVIARNPAQYGFDLTAEPVLAYESVTLPGPVDLRRIAEWTGTTVGAIQDLNPELRRWTTPVNRPDYEIKVPQGTASTLSAQLADMRTADLATLQWHTVRRGETLTTIAKRLGVGRRDLADANYLSLKATVKPGQNLVIPVEPTRLLAGQPARPQPTADARPATSSASVTARAQRDDNTDMVKVIYSVKSGDTLTSVARSFRTSVASLKTWNRLTSDRLTPGLKLTIFTARRQKS